MPNFEKCKTGLRNNLGMAMVFWDLVPSGNESILWTVRSQKMIRVLDMKISQIDNHETWMGYLICDEKSMRKWERNLK